VLVSPLWIYASLDRCLILIFAGGEAGAFGLQLSAQLKLLWREHPALLSRFKVQQHFLDDGQLQPWVPNLIFAPSLNPFSDASFVSLYKMLVMDG